MKLTYTDTNHAYYLDGKRCKGVSTVAKIPTDTWGIDQWVQRQVAIGLAIDRNLVENVAIDVDNRDAINAICEQARIVASSHRAADRGTQMHRVLQLVLLDQEYRLLTEQQRRDADVLKRTLDRYQLKPYEQLTEQFVIWPDHAVAGRFDAVLERPDGTLVLTDLKGLSLDTKLPTPTGWTTMGAVAVGDRVLGANGRPCAVTAKSAVKRIGTYVVTFDDGTKVVCDREHIWWTTTRLDRRSRIDTSPRPRPIEEIADTLVYHGQKDHCVPVAEPLQLPEVELPIDPYLLGVWLGDGRRRSGNITKEDALFDILESDGHQLGTRYTGPSGCPCRTVLGLTKLLRLNGLQHNKHIPEAYLRASHRQRLLLLQGLMDTDGTWNKPRKSAVFNSTDKALALAVEELLLTLGQRPNLASYNATGYMKTVTAYAVEFTPRGLNPFRLPRKRDQAEASSKSLTRASRRLIVDVEPGPDVETACIAVDSVSSLYLCSERMIPTHNSGPNAVAYPHATSIQLALYARAPLISENIHTAGDRSIITDWRMHPERLERRYAYVLLVTPDSEVGTLHEIDIQHGWAAGRIALEIVRWRKEFNNGRDSVREVPAATVDGLDGYTATAIAGCKTVDSLRGLWTLMKNSGDLSEPFKRAALARFAELDNTPATAIGAGI